MTKPLKVGVIGGGWFTQAVHLPILSRLLRVELIALAEPDSDETAARITIDLRHCIRVEQ